MDTLDAQRLEKIRQLETVEVKQEVEKEVVHQKPVFLTPLNNLDRLKEGEHAHLECRVEPINDPNLKIEWYVLNSYRNIIRVLTDSSILTLRWSRYERGTGFFLTHLISSSILQFN